MSIRIARRFPVKGWRLLKPVLLVLHLVFGLLCYLILGLSWMSALVFCSGLVSYLASIKHVEQISNAPDDLCWTGKNWLMQPSSPGGDLYLTLQPGCWLSHFACLLQFKSENQQHQWLFAKNELGDRLYSELVYLVNQQIRNSAKP